MDTLDIIYKYLEEHFHHSQLEKGSFITPKIKIKIHHIKRCYTFIKISDNPSIIICTNINGDGGKRNPDNHWKVERRTFDLNHPNCLQELTRFITPPINL